jgi:hypothetical protein
LQVEAPFVSYWHLAIEGLTLFVVFVGALKASQSKLVGDQIAITQGKVKEELKIEQQKVKDELQDGQRGLEQDLAVHTMEDKQVQKQLMDHLNRHDIALDKIDQKVDELLKR